MKKITVLIIALLLGGITTNSFSGTQKQKTQTFQISGEIKGLSKGDTLSFERKDPFDFYVPAFDVIVKEGGKFSYKGTQKHSNNYIMTYKPAKGTALRSSKRGQGMFIRDGDKLYITGNRQFYAFAKVQGGCYDHPLLSRVIELEDSLEMKRTELYQKAEEARKQKNEEETKKYTDAANQFVLTTTKTTKIINELWNQYYESPETSELTAAELFDKSSFTPVDQLSEPFNKLPKKIQESYYGNLLSQRIDLIKSLESGQPAPPFTLTGEKTIRLDDFKGKYLLIYHWGTCAGSMQIDPRVTELYEKTNRSELEIIGVTKDFKNVEQLNKSVDPSEEIFGINIKERTTGMLNHSYPDFDLNITTNDIDKRYLFGGLPFFVFISPEGEILARGFHEAFAIASNHFTKPSNGK